MPPQPEHTENTNPYATSQTAAYAPPAPQSQYQPDTGVQTFGAKGSMRSEHNLGGDGEERSSVKVHHPPGGGGSLNIFGRSGGEPTYAPPQYEAPSSNYNAPVDYSSVAAGKYSGGFDHLPGKAPLADYNHQYEENKQVAAPVYQPPAPSAPSGPSGFQSSTAYDSYTPVEPSHLAVSSGGNHTFGQRVESGSNSGPTTDKSSIRVHAPPGGKSSIFF